MDPFAILGVSRDVTVDVARSAWREKARVCHPDAGGSDSAMQELNEALRRVLASLADNAIEADRVPRSNAKTRTEHTEYKVRDESTSDRNHFHWARTSKDVSSFTIDCLPVEAFKALLIAASWHGDIAVDDSPYLLEMVMRDPFPCWIRFDIVPEAGASMVSVSVATSRGEKPVSSEAIRDVFVDSLNQLNWEDISAG
jgi:hypothetical protein